MERVEVYQDKSGEYRWRRRSGNNAIVADSGEGYEALSSALAAAERVSPGIEVMVLATEPLDADHEPEPK